MKFRNLYFLFQIFCGYRIILSYWSPETLKNIRFIQNYQKTFKNKFSKFSFRSSKEKYFYSKLLQYSRRVITNEKFYKKACSNVTVLLGRDN